MTEHKKKTALIGAVVVLALVLIIGAAIGIFSQQKSNTKELVPNGYNAHDYQKVVAFLEQTDSNGKKNGEKINNAYQADDPSTWTYQDGSLTRGVIWTDSKDDKHVLCLDFDSKDGLYGQLDLSDCTELEEVYCLNGELDEINVSGCGALETLWCENNNLTSLDVSTNQQLWNLNCASNALTMLDVGQNPELANLFCMGNELTKLDVTKNPKLTTLYCWDNKLEELDLSQNTELASLDCQNNQLKALDIKANGKLTDVSCGKNAIVQMDVSGNPALTYLDVSYNQLAELILHGNTSLEQLYCNENQLTVLDLSSTTKLSELDCAGNNLSSLDVSAVSAIPIHTIQSDGVGNVAITYKLETTQNVADDSNISSGSTDAQQSFSASADNSDVSGTYGGDGTTDMDNSIQQTKMLIAVPADESSAFLGWYTSDGKLLSKDQMIQMDDFAEVTDFVAKFQ